MQKTISCESPLFSLLQNIVFRNVVLTAAAGAFPRFVFRRKAGLDVQERAAFIAEPEHAGPQPPFCHRIAAVRAFPFVAGCAEIHIPAPAGRAIRPIFNSGIHAPTPVNGFVRKPIKRHSGFAIRALYKLPVCVHFDLGTALLAAHNNRNHALSSFFHRFIQWSFIFFGL